MTETQNDPSTEPSPPPKKRGSAGRLIALLLLALVGAGVLAGIAYWPSVQKNLPGMSASDDSPLRQRLGSLEQKVEALDQRVSDLDTRISAIASAHGPAAPANNEPQAPKISTTEIARMQSDLVALSAAVSNLQAEVKQTGSTAAAMRAQTQAALAETVAFMQLRAQAESGHGFADALAALQTAAADDPAFKEPLGKLAPYADKGAPGIGALREQLTGMTGDVERATAEAEAQNWWQRIMAKLKGLVSIRPLHGTSSPGGALELMQADLASEDISAALDEMKNMQAEAQKTLESWRSSAEARRNIDDALRVMAGSLINGPREAPGQDKP